MYFPLAGVGAIATVAGFAGEFGAANTVCFSKVRSLQSAEINGRSMCLLCSRNTLISIVGVIDIDLVSSCDTDEILFGAFGMADFVGAVVRSDDVTGTSIC